MNDLTAEAAQAAEEEKREFSTDLVRSHILHHSLLTGKMPVPQRVDFLVERASCPFIKGLLTMVQHLSSIKCAVDRLYWNIWLSAFQGRKRTKFLTTK